MDEAKVFEQFNNVDFFHSEETTTNAFPITSPHLTSLSLFLSLSLWLTHSLSHSHRPMNHKKSKK